MPKHEFSFPEGYDDDASIIESKGWMIGILRVEGLGIFTLCFCCPTRLQQDVHAELAFQPCYFQKNLIIVAEVTRTRVQEAVEWLLKETSLRDLTMEAP